MCDRIGQYTDPIKEGQDDEALIFSSHNSLDDFLEPACKSCFRAPSDAPPCRTLGHRVAVRLKAIDASAARRRGAVRLSVDCQAIDAPVARRRGSTGRSVRLSRLVLLPG